MPDSSPSVPGLVIRSKTEAGLALTGTFPGATIPTTASVFAPGCRILDTSTVTMYQNVGTAASPSWTSQDQISTSEIADGAITAAKVRTTEARTATADGTTTGAITAPTSLITVVTVTSSSATNQIALPAITSAGIGNVIYLNVGSNGYELITPAASNNTINLVDSDGTNQLDVAANTTVRATQVSDTSWLCETIAATTIAVTAPDND